MKLKDKIELLNRIQALGFSFEDAQMLRRIQLILHKWAEQECNGQIERDEQGKPWAVRRGSSTSAPDLRWRIADRESGALRRLKAIVDFRNDQARSYDMRRESSAGHVFFYHQTDPRGCALYLVRRDQLGDQSLHNAYHYGLAIC